MNDEVKKAMELHSRCSLLWRSRKKLSDKYHLERKIKKCKNKTNYFKNCISSEKILPKKLVQKF